MPALDMAYNQITPSTLLTATDAMKCYSQLCVCKKYAWLVWAFLTKSKQRTECKEMNHQSQYIFFFRDLVCFTTCLCQIGHLQAIQLGMEYAWEEITYSTEQSPS
jgi:hypothetical protein